MKKVFLILGLCVITAIAVYAQLTEVRGLETEQVPRKNYYYYDFKFRNTNNFKVSVEAERWTRDPISEKAYILDTKNFILNAGQTYTWEAKDGSGLQSENGRKLIISNIKHTKYLNNLEVAPDTKQGL